MIKSRYENYSKKVEENCGNFIKKYYYYFHYYFHIHKTKKYNVEKNKNQLD